MLSTIAALARHAVRVPIRRAFGPKDPDRPHWTTKFEILVTGLREAFEESAHMSVGERRALMESLTAPTSLVWKLRRERVDANGVPATWFLPPKAVAAPVLLYFHGGAYQFGSVKMYTDFLCRLALAANLPVLAIDYRLAPEFPFPAQLEDALRVWDFLQKRASPVVVAGDSAGGNLSLALAIALRDRGAVMPKKIGLICPWVDLGDGGPSRQTNSQFDTLPGNVGDAWARTYAAGHALDDPRLSVGLADLKGLPPMLVHAGGREIIRDDVRAFVERARAAGLDVTHLEYPEMVHVWHLFASFGIPESRRAIEELARFASESLRG